VPWLSLLRLTMSGMPSSSRRCAVTGMHTMPRPCVTMKLIASGVTFSAAMMKSPSFSRSASSVTITSLPARTSAMTSSTGSNGQPGIRSWPGRIVSVALIKTKNPEATQPSGSKVTPRLPQQAGSRVLLSSGLYRRLRSRTGSTLCWRGVAGFTAGRESPGATHWREAHPALKTYNALENIGPARRSQQRRPPAWRGRCPGRWPARCPRS
jgi:hypothetical protein